MTATDGSEICLNCIRLDLLSCPQCSPRPASPDLPVSHATAVARASEAAHERRANAEQGKGRQVNGRWQSDDDYTPNGDH